MRFYSWIVSVEIHKSHCKITLWSCETHALSFDSMVTAWLNFSNSGVLTKTRLAVQPCLLQTAEERVLCFSLVPRIVLLLENLLLLNLLPSLATQAFSYPVILPFQEKRDLSVPIFFFPCFFFQLINKTNLSYSDYSNKQVSIQHL